MRSVFALNLPDTFSVTALAEILGVKPEWVLAPALAQGIFLEQDGMTNIDVATLVAEELGVRLVLDVRGVGEVRDAFRLREGTVAATLVTHGTIHRGYPVRITRDGETVFHGGIRRLGRFESAIEEVGAGKECGIKFDGFDDPRPGDIIESLRV